MATDKFQEFIEQQLKQIQVTSNLDAKKNEWLSAIEDLYRDIEKWLTPYGASLSFQRGDLTLSEELLGTYKTTRMDIHLAGRTVSLIPVALFVIGAYGRIDMIGQKQIMKLVRLPEEINEFKVRYNVSQDILGML